MDCLSITDPRRVPALPLRPSWLAEEAIDREANIHKSSKHLMDTWNAWADCVEKAFQQMGDQTEGLEVSEDAYINFIHMLASHPARHSQRPLENLTEHEDWFIKTMHHRYLTYLHSLWTAYADKLETTYINIAAELGRCTLQASPVETTSTRGQLRGIFCSMLGPGRLFQGVAVTRTHEVVAAETSLQAPSTSQTDQLVYGIEHMSLCSASTTHTEGAEGLAVKLKNMSIEAGMSRID